MPARNLFRRLAVVSATALAVATLTAPSATAAPVFSVSQFSSDTFAHEHSGDCTATETSTSDAATSPWSRTVLGSPTPALGTRRIQTTPSRPTRRPRSTPPPSRPRSRRPAPNPGTHRHVRRRGRVSIHDGTRDVRLRGPRGRRRGVRQFSFPRQRRPAGLTVQSQRSPSNTYTELPAPRAQLEGSVARTTTVRLEADDPQDHPLLPAGELRRQRRGRPRHPAPRGPAPGRLRRRHASSPSRGRRPPRRPARAPSRRPCTRAAARPTPSPRVVTEHVEAGGQDQLRDVFVIDKKVLRDGSPEKSEAYSLPVATDVRPTSPRWSAQETSPASRRRPRGDEHYLACT